MATYTTYNKPTSSTPKRVVYYARAECRTCMWHVRIAYPNAQRRAGWCSGCHTLSVYDIEATRPPIAA
jgi:hypothetical protein